MSERSEALKRFEGKSVKIETVSGLFFHTNNLQVLGDMIIFSDRFGLIVSLPVDEVKIIQELRK